MLTFTGHFSLDDMTDAARASDDLIEATGATHRIADFRSAQPLELTLDEIHGLARLLSAGSLSLAHGRDAIVGARAVFAGGEESYEYMVSQWTPGDLQVRRFEDIDEARAWVSEDRIQSWALKQSDGGVHVTFCGPVDLRDIEQAIGESDELLAENSLGHVVADLRHIEPVKLDVDQLHQLARRATRGPRAESNGRLAIVTAAGVFDRGGETFHFMVDNWQTKGELVMAFHDIDEARDWASAATNDD